MHQAVLACCLTLLAMSQAGKYTGNKQRQQISSNDSGDLIRSPEYFGLRASETIETPIKLAEPADEKYDPKPKDINYNDLRKRLGGSFEREFMSVHRPLHFRPNNSNNVEYDFPFRKNKRGRLVPREDASLPDWIRKLRFRHLWLPDGTKARTSVGGKRLEHKLQNYLWAHTSCPVVYIWRDFGKRFWPRWIKEGHCPAGKQSCSVPPGMMCQTAGIEYKQFYRWHCKDWSSPRECQWIKIHYPIVTSCACSCPKN